MILCCVVLTQYSSVTDRQTDGRKDASAVTKTRLALHAVARKKTVANERKTQQVWCGNGTDTGWSKKNGATLHFPKYLENY